MPSFRYKEYVRFWASPAIIANVSKIPSPLTDLTEKHVPMLLTKSGGQ